MHLRDINIKDMQLIFDWANDDEVRQNAINKNKIIWEEHKEWISKKILNPNSQIFILQDEEKTIGQIRFDKTKAHFEIDYSIDKRYRGLGYGHKILCLGIQKLNQKVRNVLPIKALVQENNIASKKIFKNAKFIESGQQLYNGMKYIVYMLKPKANTYIILSSKKWNSNILIYLKNAFPWHNWIMIDNKDNFTLEQLDKVNPHTIFIPHWSLIIPSKIYSKYNCIVFHMTDLPYGRGGSPLQNLIERGYKKTKVSALKVIKEIDAGDIFLKKELNLFGTAEEIFIRANTLIETMIFEIVTFDLKPKPQEGNVVYFKRRTPEMSKIDENLQEIEKLYDHIRMLDAEGYPKAYLETNFFKFEFTRAALKTNETIITDVRIIKK
ncbi:GNAT family N-acetyltransferase [Mariniflexile litorale]|uniref:GNAT family N-acetyltransferase n=1 Tax=Mariniflexile litorale TaxID=3045158 RepID=A0AAU7EL90_9FLAO